MDNTPDDGNKLPDLVVNQETSETFNVATKDQAISVSPGSMELAPDNTNDTNIPTPMGYDTATTDEEEAVEALLVLSNLPDMNDECNDSDDNATLMPIDGPCRSIDVNPVEVKLGTDDISQAIEQLPSESRLPVATRTTHADANINSPKTNPRPTSNPDTSPPTSPMKGTLRVKNYGL